VPGDYTTIQGGINSSQNGDTVLVSHGNYYEGVIFLGHNITLSSFFLLDGDIAHIDSTVIDGNGYSSVIRFQNGEDSTAKVIGFTLRRGMAYYGGGIYCVNSSPAISFNIITENTAYGFEVTILGGGAYFSNSNPLINNNIFKENMSVGSYGSYGGGAFFYNSNPVLTNNLFINNEADRGGGIFCDGMSTLTIRNSILWENHANVDGDELMLDDLVWPQITYCDIKDTLLPGAGNMSVYPKFRDTAGDFHLMSTACGNTDSSPLIDAGDPSIYDQVLSCAWGLGTSRSDIGAFGGNAHLVGIPDQDMSRRHLLSLFQNYPNPFNATTSIGFSIADASPCAITIYDITGRKVTRLFDGLAQAGDHSIIWDIGALPSGVYFARLTTGVQMRSIKMIVAK
jgi:predicted outer membrane repeat protein